MNKREYEHLQERFSNKIIQRPTNREEEYNKGILTAKSILHEVFTIQERTGKKKQKYEITLNGCDDDTTFVMELSEPEYLFLSRVSELANKTSTYGCMPRMYVEKIEDQI